MSSLRRRHVEETLERLRLASPECSGLADEEEEESKVEQATSANPKKKEYCCKCNMTFGLAEKRVAIDSKRVMHEDCYEKHLHELAQRTERLNRIRTY